MMLINALRHENEPNQMFQGDLGRVRRLPVALKWLMAIHKKNHTIQFHILKLLTT